MKSQRLLSHLLTGLLLIAAVGCTNSPVEDAPTPPIEEPAEAGLALVLGDISDDPREVIEGAQPLADYLAARLTTHGITEGQVKIASSPGEMTEWLKSGEVDLFFDSVYPATLISDQTGAAPILRRWRHGVESYYTVIFTTHDSGIESLEDLNGHMLALDNPYSTSGYVLPAVYLIEQGLTLEGKAGFEEAIAADEIGFMFSYDDENTLQWVLSGVVDAGATDDWNFNQYQEKSDGGLLVLGTTDAVPRQVVMARPEMDAALLETVTAALLVAHEDEEGRIALEAFDNTARFDEFPEGITAAQESMRNMLDTVQNIPTP